jgi:hypothetical protein
MTQTGSKGPRLGRGGVRVFENARGRWTGRAWVAVGALAVVATVILVLRTAVGLFHAEPPAQPLRAPAAPAAGLATRPAEPAGATMPRRRIDVVDAGQPGGPISRREPPSGAQAPARGPAVAVEPVPAPAPTPAPAAEGPSKGLLDEVLESLRAHGTPTGIAVYPPKGTNPPKTGLVVPDDYALPDGYVRYYQSTDEGRRLEPILMFSPDYELVDEHGNAVPLPENGIVPPEMAPPGMPIRMLELPPEVRPTPQPR